MKFRQRPFQLASRWVTHTHHFQLESLKFSIFRFIVVRLAKNFRNVLGTHIKLLQSMDFVTLDFMLYISYKTTFFKNVIVKSFLNKFWIIFVPEEAEIFKDYLFILAWFSIRLPLFSYDLKTIFVFLTSNLVYILTKHKIVKINICV